jgi:hypothetical protein
MGSREAGDCSRAAAGDYRAMTVTGGVCRRFRQVRQGKRMRLIGAAIETGQDQPDGPDRCPFDAK